MATSLTSYLSNALGYSAEVNMSQAPPVSAAVAAVNGGYKVPANGNGNNDEDDGKDMYDQFGRMVLVPTKVATLKDNAAATMGASYTQCCRDARNPALSNWLLLTEGLEIQNGFVFMIAQEGVFYTTVRARAADYLGYMLKFKNYLSRYRQSEHQTLLDCRRARQRFWGNAKTYMTPLANIAPLESLRICIDPEQDTAFGPVVAPGGPGPASDYKHVSTEAGSGALATRAASVIAAARAKKKEEIKARTEAMRRRYASGESVGQLVRAGGDSRVATVQPTAEKTLAAAQTNQLSDAFALWHLGSETGKAAAQIGNKDEGKVARAMKQQAAAQVREVAAGWSGAMTFVNASTAVAKQAGSIWVLDGEGTSLGAHPVYVVADDRKANWYIVKVDTFDKMCGIGRSTRKSYESTHRVQIAGAGSALVEVVPLTAKTIYVAAGHGGRASHNLAEAYDAQLTVIKEAHGRNQVATSDDVAVYRGRNE